MKKNTSLATKNEDDGSDALSTATHNSGHHSGREHSPSQNINPNYEENDSINDNSKRIRKKRNAYQKIDDDVRLKLLEAVQKHGETLKSAAKKYKINYSSAKSILHTYRKEGRILKKSAQERNIKRNPGEGGDDDNPDGMEAGDLENSHETQPPQKTEHNSEVMRIEVPKDQKEEMKAKGISPMHGIMDNFVNLLKLSAASNDQNNDPATITQAQASKVQNKPSIITDLPEVSQIAQSNPTALMSSLGGLNSTLASMSAMNLPNQASLANLANLSQIFQGNQADKRKVLDNFCMNYSNIQQQQQQQTPLKDITEEAENQAIADVTNTDLEAIGESLSLPNPTKQGDEICMPHPLRFNSAQLLQEKIESKINEEEDSDWNATIENAAIETFKSFMDAQLLLCDALKKASYLNNLMQIQKSKKDGSPVESVQPQGFKNI